MVASLAIQTRERERHNQQRLNMRGLRQKPGTQPRQPDLTGTPWLKPMLPMPGPDEAFGTILGWLSLLPFMKRLTRSEKRWRQ